MENDITLYSHAESMHNKVHAKTLWLEIRKTYTLKSILLAISLPFDILLFIYIILKGKKYDIIFSTRKWPDLITATSRSANVALLSAPNSILFCYRNNVEYVPASLFYLLTSIGVWIPKKIHKNWSLIAIKSIDQFLGQLYKDKASLVVHSDALPFGRALVLASRNLSVRTICIQHGNFREYNIVEEQDGFLCDVNITRSAEDSRIIKKSNPSTILIAIPDFFLPNVCNRQVGPTPRVLLLGEGFHVLDRDFNKTYIQYLQCLAKKLKDIGLEAVFRPHPSERNRYWGRTFKNIDYDDLSASLGRTDAIIGFNSTLLQEAAEIDIPTFYVDPLHRGHEIVGRNNIKILKFIDVYQIHDAAYFRFNSVESFHKKKDRADVVNFVAKKLLTKF